jgi:hypothetical protein
MTYLTRRVEMARDKLRPFRKASIEITAAFPTPMRPGSGCLRSLAQIS